MTTESEERAPSGAVEDAAPEAQPRRHAAGAERARPSVPRAPAAPGRPPRIVERSAVWAYRAAEWSLGHLPPRPAWTVGAWLTQAGYLAWPAKRRGVDANFAHVLRTDRSDPRVRRMALAAYRNYARYLVELMRLPSIPVAQAEAQLDHHGLDSFEAIRVAATKGLIFVVGHIGNNEAVAAGFARMGWPVNVVADDSTLPELFAHLERQRSAWGVHLIPWRNLREVFGVLRRGEMLGLLVDWGYRPDGIPVRLFDAWTTLPAGPAVLAGKTGAIIVPVVVRRHEDGRFFVTYDEPIAVSSTDPKEVAEATQRIAAWLERSIEAAPEQWYSFKPIWPEDPAEAARLAARAAEVTSGS